MVTTMDGLTIQVTQTVPKQAFLLTDDRVYPIGGWLEVDRLIEELQYARAQMIPNEPS